MQEVYKVCILIHVIDMVISDISYVRRGRCLIMHTISIVYVRVHDRVRIPTKCMQVWSDCVHWFLCMLDYAYFILATF